MLWFIKKVNSYFLRSLDSSLFFRKWIFLHKGVGGRGMGGFRRITWFLISGKMEGGIICRRQSIKGGGEGYRKLTASQMPIIRWGNEYKNITTSPSPTMVQSLPLAHVIYVWGLRWSDTAKLCNSEDTSVTCWLHKQVHYAWF